MAIRSRRALLFSLCVYDIGVLGDERRSDRAVFLLGPSGRHTPSTGRTEDLGRERPGFRTWLTWEVWEMG